MKNIFYILLFIIPLLFVFSCKKDIEGCIDSSAINYNSEATVNNNSCVFDSDGDGISDADEVLGCTNSIACNFDINATDDNESCLYPELGYDCDGNITAEIGDVMEGGYLFYIDDTGEHGLVCALEDIGGNNVNINTFEWGVMKSI